MVIIHVSQAGRRRMPGERIAEHLSERAPTDAGNHDKHDYIGYYTNIDYIFVYVTDITNMCQTTWRVIIPPLYVITCW